MSAGQVQKVADAILYEGYALYPYRASSVKNQQRWTFGGLYPAAYAPRTGDRSSFQAQVLISGPSDPVIEAAVRFLHLVDEEKAEQSWQTGIEREVLASSIDARPVLHFPGLEEGRRRRRSTARASRRHGRDTRARPSTGAFKSLHCRLANVTDLAESNELSRDEASLRALISAHAILRVAGGEFVSHDRSAGTISPRRREMRQPGCLAGIGGRTWRARLHAGISDYPFRLSRRWRRKVPAISSMARRSTRFLPCAS